MSKFYDTSSLLLAQEKAFEEPFHISSVTIGELEHIKVSDTKSPDTKFKARSLVRLLDSHRDSYTVVIDDTAVRSYLEKHFLPLSNDNLILSSAAMTSCDVVYSDDLCMRLVGELIFGLNMAAYDNERLSDTLYTGYKQVQMSSSEYAIFQHTLNVNEFGCLQNEYLIIYDGEFEFTDCYKWDGNNFVSTYNKTLKSLSMGDKIKPKDEMQRCAIDSLITNTVTALSGKAGSGKTLLALSAAMYLIDSHKYENLVILFNPTSTRGSAKMGFYSGSALEKAKQTSIGHILTSKFGDQFIVDNLIATGRIRLISMADARGLEIDDKSILFITECQNTSTDLLKLCLQRVSAGSKVFIEGDYNSQVDDICFSGENNGLKKAIELFKGDELFGYVHLPNIWRSKVAELADKLS